MKKLKALVVLEKIINISDYGRYMEELETIKEAIKELEELNSRSCDSCKHFEEINDKCNRGIFLNWKHEIDDNSFYCSRYEAKGE